MQDDTRVVELIARYQGEMLGCILSLVYRWSDAQDVLQETNIKLWESRDSAPPDGEFLPWACTIAYYQVLTYRKRNQRSRLFFSEELITDLAAASAKSQAAKGTEAEALQHCIGRLPSNSSKLLKSRYFSQKSIEEIAAEMERSVRAITQSLYRIRKQLLECIQDRIKASNGGMA